MDLTLTEDQELIARTARELLAARASGAGARALAGDETGYSTALWKEMVELGWLGMAVPEEYGGLGIGFLESCLLIEELGAAQVPTPYLVTQACVAQPIARHGTERMREHWLPEIVGGRVVSCAPPDWSSTGQRLTASARPDGSYQLTGTAHFVPFAAAARDVLVVATDSAGGQTALLVDARASGITRRPLDVVGFDRPGHLELTEVVVPPDRVLGAPGQGGEVADTVATYGAAATAAEMVGGAGRVLDLTVAYAKERTQFGRPIGSFQAVQHHCADMAIDVLGARLAAYEAIWRLSQPETSPETNAGETALAVASAKSWASEAYQRVCARGHQVHGAIGFTEEHDLHLYLRHAMTSALAFGDGDYHADRVADLIGL